MEDNITSQRAALGLHCILGAVSLAGLEVTSRNDNFDPTWAETKGFGYIGTILATLFEEAATISLLFIFFELLHCIITTLPVSNFTHSRIQITHWVLFGIAGLIALLRFGFTAYTYGVGYSGSDGGDLDDFRRVTGAYGLTIAIISFEIMIWLGVLNICIEPRKNRRGMKTPLTTMLAGSVFFVTNTLMDAITDVLWYMENDFIDTSASAYNAIQICHVLLYLGIYALVLLCCLKWKFIIGDFPGKMESLAEKDSESEGPKQQKRPVELVAESRAHEPDSREVLEADSRRFYETDSSLMVEADAECQQTCVRSTRNVETRGPVCELEASRP
ncbi:hypothetical protein N7493_010465 [Penicillium malachiteum]|uniref:Uncharacterized protein n=1 Tax=Penicillium malachiteum TaxID=1324776 RepID=A0AAD6MRP4_9EURO|nr:hypothetical protein N7493_010465 [Penicillium malachiteum]